MNFFFILDLTHCFRPSLTPTPPPPPPKKENNRNESSAHCLIVFLFFFHTVAWFFQWWPFLSTAWENCAPSLAVSDSDTKQVSLSSSWRQLGAGSQCTLWQLPTTHAKEWNCRQRTTEVINTTCSPREKVCSYRGSARGKVCFFFYWSTYHFPSNVTQGQAFDALGWIEGLLVLIWCEQEWKWNKGKCNIMNSSGKMSMGTSTSRTKVHGCCFKCKLKLGLFCSLNSIFNLGKCIAFWRERHLSDTCFIEVTPASEGSLLILVISARP